MAYPSPLSALDLQQNVFFICHVRQGCVAEGVRLEYFADNVETFVFKSLKPLCDGIGD